MSFMFFLYSLLINSANNGTTSDLFGWDISIWQIVLIPIILALIELLKYIYRQYADKIGGKRDDNTEHIKQVEKAVQDIIDKTMQDDVNDMTNSNLSNENKYVLSIIKKQLDMIRRNIDADRVWIAKFHNGHDNETYTKKNQYQLFSILEESLDYGISSHKKFFYNIPVVFYNFILERVSTDNSSYIEDVNDLDPSLNLVMKLQGIKSTGAIGIRNDNNDLKAIIGYDFIKDKKELDEENVKYIKNHSDVFLEYLQLHRMYKRKLEK